MPKVAREMTALDVRRLKHPGGDSNVLVTVGGVTGLGLLLAPSGGRSWLLRVMVGGKRREIGLGGYPDVSLASAREKAREAREAIREGRDPVEERKASRAALMAEQGRMTFRQAIAPFLDGRLEGYRSKKHRDQWRATLLTYAVPVLGSLPLADIAPDDVRRALAPIWADKRETASRTRGRIEAVLDWAKVHGHRSGENPARWRGNLDVLLPKSRRVGQSDNHPALSLSDMPVWFAALQHLGGLAPQALAFLTLCASRSGEVRGMTWDELNGDVWTIPAKRMKAGLEHRVPLSKAALAILEKLPRNGSETVFWAPRGGQFSDMALSAVMRRMHAAETKAGRSGWLDQRSKRPAVPHGVRSTFRDWAAEMTSYPSDMAEIALAHKVGSEVERAYRRGDMIEKRRAMMEAWAHFVTTPPGETAPTAQGRRRSIARTPQSA